MDFPYVVWYIPESGETVKKSGAEESRRKDVMYAEKPAVAVETEILRARLAAFNEATLCIAEDLDINSVLQKIVDGACSLTGAKYGALSVFGRNGGIEYFITCGISQGERESMGPLPEGEGLIGHINEIRSPLIVEEIAEHPESIGVPAGHPEMTNFLGTPIFFHDNRLGNIYLANKRGGEGFSSEDAETITVFASHAASAISNARMFRDERRAKADLEALVETSPVGVLVFDAKTKALLSLNQETRRIVRGLPVPGRGYEDLLSVLTLRRPDGQEIPPEEVVIERVRRTGQTMRAEQVIIELPDGQSVSTIVNATPVFSEEGEVESVIATIQDMTPLERLERMRSEFIAMVSQQLRTPLATIKGSIATVLSPPSAFDQNEMELFLRVIDEQSDRMRSIISNLLDMTQIETGTLSVSPEPTDLAELVEGARRALLRSGGATNVIEADLARDLPLIEVDRQRMTQVLYNLLTYASLFSPDQSTINVSASPEDVHVAISVVFEGMGLSAESLVQLFRKSSPADEIGGRVRSAREGLGLSVCKGIVEAHGGRIRAEMEDSGSAVHITFTVPIFELPVSRQGAGAGQVLQSAERGIATRERIFAVDDDYRLLSHLRNILREAGYVPVTASNLIDADRLMAQDEPHLVLVSLASSGVEDHEAMRRVRDHTDAPIIVMLEQSRGEDYALALDMGADDYIVKPFSSAELVSRIRVVLRSQSIREGTRRQEPYMNGDLVVDYAGRRVTVSGHAVPLTATEFDLLSELSSNAGRVLSHDQLLERVWGPAYQGDSQPVRTHVKNLRSKLGDNARKPRYIFTTPRVGYRMERGK